MAVLYLQEQGTMLKKSGNRITVTQQGETLMDLPVFKLDRILIFGNVQVSTQALGLLLEQGIDVAFFSFGGRLRGTAASTLSKNIFMRLAQYAAWQDPERKLNFARCIVASKIQNQKAVLSWQQKIEVIVQDSSLAFPEKQRKLDEFWTGWSNYYPREVEPSLPPVYLLVLRLNRALLAKDDAELDAVSTELLQVSPQRSGRSCHPALHVYSARCATHSLWKSWNSTCWER
ncbi:MAG: CRISPR-associated endonuclease Cas1 [Firmicutes bacterium]|nr:CRISPR-associated endonuclease Cas1 [Bacillota bacterium]